MNWKDIPGYEGYYQVSDLGQVKSLTRQIINSKGVTINVNGKILKPRLSGARDAKNKYYSVVLNIDGNSKQFNIHRLVAMMFCENDNPDIKTIVNHIDNNSLNNVYTNLEWTTVEGNNQHRHKQGRSSGASGSQNGRSKLTDEQVAEIKTLLASKKLSQEKIAKMYGVVQTTISSIKLNKAWK